MRKEMPVRLHAGLHTGQGHLGVCEGQYDSELVERINSGSIPGMGPNRTSDNCINCGILDSTIDQLRQEIESYKDDVSSLQDEMRDMHADLMDARSETEASSYGCGDLR